jgi:DNA polymerase elongation subunit (family B)
LKLFNNLREINPDILVGYNSDYFDIPYLYYRLCNVFDKEVANMLISNWYSNDESEWNRDGWLKIAGTESLDYMKLHKKFSFRDEPSFKLDALGKKYVGLEKIEYEGSLDRLFKEDKQKFIAYNFRDVEILKSIRREIPIFTFNKKPST